METATTTTEPKKSKGISVELPEGYVMGEALDPSEVPWAVRDALRLSSSVQIRLVHSADGQPLYLASKVKNKGSFTHICHLLLAIVFALVISLALDVSLYLHAPAPGQSQTSVPSIYGKKSKQQTHWKVDAPLLLAEHRNLLAILCMFFMMAFFWSKALLKAVALCMGWRIRKPPVGYMVYPVTHEPRAALPSPIVSKQQEEKKEEVY